MTERLLQFIWQYQYFNKTDLRLNSGEPLQVISAGQFNTNQGPDFLEAKIKIGNTLWAGHIELHLHESDWNKHAHDQDPNYRNVILHVVWSNNTERLSLPTLSLIDRTSKLLLDRYEGLMKSKEFVPCAGNLHQVKEIVWLSWKERLLAERLQRKVVMIKEYLQQSNQHWEEIFWWVIARNFGIPINIGAFEAMAKSIPVNLLAKHKNQLHQLEALLLGQSGLLQDDFNEEYPKLLKREYFFLRKKYKLKPIHEPIHFLRMRPGNFPTVRLAQLAMLISQSAHLFSKIKEVDGLAEIKGLLKLTANDYWHYHYRFDTPSNFKKKTLGEQMIENIITNTLVPVLYAYGELNKDEKYKTKALQWLENTNPEDNAITNKWKALGISNFNAYDSHALIEIKKQYCDAKRCLECAVGNSLLKG